MSTTPWDPQNLIFFQKNWKFEFWLSTKSWNHYSFVNISPTLVIDTSMERSSRVLHHGNPKIRFFSKKLEFWFLTKSWNHLSFVNISPTLVIDTSTEWSSQVPTSPWKPKDVNFFQKVGNQRNSILSVPWVSIRWEKKSPWLCQYQSYISNWYVNRTVFEYYNMGTKNLIFFFQKSLKLNLTCAEELKSTFK